MNGDALSLVVVGDDAIVGDVACACIASEKWNQVRAVPLPPGDGFVYDLHALERYDRSQWRALAVWSHASLNFARLKLMSDLRLAGWRLERYISPRSTVPTDWKAGENTLVFDGVVVGGQGSAKHNCWIGPRAILGSRVALGHSVWIGSGAIVGNDVKVGSNTSIGAGAIVADGVSIGDQCELLLSGDYRHSIADKTFYSPQFPNPVGIVSASLQG